MEPYILLYVEGGPSNHMIKENAKYNRESEFIIVSAATGKSDRMFVRIPEDAANSTEIQMTGQFKSDRLRYAMVYYPQSGTGLIRIFRNTKKEEG